MDDEPGDGAPPPARPLRGMIDPALHRPAPAPTAPPVGPPRPARRGDLLVDDPIDDADGSDDDRGGGSDELRVDAAPMTLVRLVRLARARPGRTLAAVIALALLVCAGITVHGFVRDRRETFSQDQVMAAMAAFRVPTASNSVREIGSDPATGSEPDVLTVSPAECTPLISLRPAGALGGAEWLDVSGPTYDSTQLQILRFSSPRAAAATLGGLADSLPGCASIDVTYTAGGDPDPQVLIPVDDSTSSDRLVYRTELVGPFYYDVRQFGNTIIWVYGSGTSALEVRAGAAADLVAQLERAAAE